MQVYMSVFMALHILVEHHNVVGWRDVLNYMRTPPTVYYLESTGQVAYMKTHPKGQTRPNVKGIWWGRVHMRQLATAIFSNPRPPTNLLLQVKTSSSS